MDLLDIELKDDESRELKEEASARSALLYHKDRYEQGKDMVEMGSQDQDVKSQELIHASATIDSDQRDTSLRNEDSIDTSVEKGEGTEEEEVTSEFDGLIKEISGVGTYEKIQTSASESGLEIIDGNQLQQVDEEAETSSLIKEYEIKGAKDEEAGKTAEDNTDQEIRSTADSVTRDSDQQDTSSTYKDSADASVEKGEGIEEEKVTSEFDRLSKEISGVVTDEKIETSPSDSGMKIIKENKLQHVDKEAESSSGIEEPEIKGTIDEDVRKTDVGNKDGEIRHTGDSITTESCQQDAGSRNEDVIDTSEGKGKEMRGEGVPLEVDRLSKEISGVVIDEKIETSPSDSGLNIIEGNQLYHVDKEAESSSVVKDSEIKGTKDEDIGETDLGNTDGEIKCTAESATIILEQQDTNSRNEDGMDTSLEKGKGTVEDKVTSEVDRLSKEISGVTTDEKIQTSPSDSGLKINEGNQLQHVDKEAESSSVIRESKIKGTNDEVGKINVENKDGDIKRTADFLSSGRSTRPLNAPARPAGLGGAAPLLEPAPRAAQQPRLNGGLSQTRNQHIEDMTNGETEENDETREKLQMIRVKFLRLAHRLGQTPHNVVVAQVLYRLGLAEQLRGRNGTRVGAFSFDRASAMAEQLEAAGQEPLDFSCTIMVLGKTGVGKSATINSIFDEVKFGTDAFQLGTKKVQDVIGTVQGIKVRVIDTPGLLPSWSDQRQNEKILHSVKRFIKKSPPDIVLYLDRLDMQSRDFGDMPLLRTITEIFGPSIWFNAIVVLTHAASAPPEGPNGTTTSYDMFVTQRSHVVQQAIRQAAGDMRLMNPVSLVENHSACRTNRAGQRVLPNGQVWKPHLLLLSFASKILAEANTLLKLQDSPPGKPFPTRSRAPPLPFLLSSLLQSRPQLKLPEEQFADDDSMEDDLDDSSDSEDDSEYDELPPFKRLTKAQLSKLSRSQKKAYYDELEYREKLFMKKQLKEERKRRKIMKNMAAASEDVPSEYVETVEEESGGAASVPVPMPDLALPASFDSDNPTHRYRYLDSPNQWVVRPVLDNHGWDHDIGYEGVNVERLFVVKQDIPVSFSGQVTKDKKDTNFQMEMAGSIKHGEGKATSVGLDMQTLGKDIAYTMRSETKFCNYRRNKATAGLSVTVLGDALSAGVKIEDKLVATKRLRLVVSGGAMTGRGDVAYGGSLEATLRDKDHPLGRSLSTMGLSIMDWHGDLAIGGNLQSQIPIGRFTNLIARANLNNRGSGQVSVRLNTSEQFQIALIGLVPLLRKLFSYSQQLQDGQL
ncbi:Small monomeric GTPase [Bertholletia excelsa]